MIADVYSKYDLELVGAKDCYIWQDPSQKILDFYSGHGVISIGHHNRVYVEQLKDQIDQLVYYSNAVRLPIQDQLATKLDNVAQLKGLYDLFLCNSGAEAIENALKVAALANSRKKVVAFKRSFHGRTSLAVQCTDNPKIRTSLNSGLDIQFLELNNLDQLDRALDQEVAAVIVEGIQGIGGIHEPEVEFLQRLSETCKKHGICLILDEIQSGFGRSGDFFAYQKSAIRPDIITMAKGMGNGFPVAGVLVDKSIKLNKGDLGTTFGGNPLACRAVIAVLEVMSDLELLDNTKANGNYLIEELQAIPEIRQVRGRGLMIGFDLNGESATIRKKLLTQHHIICGSAQSKETIRLLPPLIASRKQCQQFIAALKLSLSS